tara:strand:- start:16 stop:354 length:339 start_codon:yes stop_codon:yes gene_type:complete
MKLKHFKKALRKIIKEQRVASKGVKTDIAQAAKRVDFGTYDGDKLTPIKGERLKAVWRQVTPITPIYDPTATIQSFPAAVCNQPDGWTGNDSGGEDIPPTPDKGKIPLKRID